jgi:hypothetical protein
MATEEINLKVRSDIKDTTKDAQQLAQEISFMGVSLKDVKGGFTTMTATAKKSFATIKAGIASTGIGLLVIAIASLATYLTQTKKGAELLKTAMSGLNAIFRVAVDRISQFGEGIAKIIDGKVLEGLKDMGKSFLGMGKEIKEDTLAAMALSEMMNKLVDDERNLRVETAKRRADIEELKLIAEDVTKSEAVRLQAAKDAFKIENDLVDKRIRNAERALEIQREEMKDRTKNIVDLDKQAELEINLENIRGESLTKQIELNNKINAITAEGEARRALALDERKKADEHMMGDLIKLQLFTEETYVKMDEIEENFFDGKKRRRQRDMKNEKMILSFRKDMANQGLAILGEAAGKGSALAKATAITQATITGVESVQNAFATASKSPLNILVPGYNYIQAGLAGTFAALQIRKIASEQGPGGGGGAGAGGVGGGGTPAPQMMSGAFDLSGVQAPEPVQAYVVTDDMTSSQDKLATIRRRATI